MTKRFEPEDFLELLDSERQWFELLNALRRQRWQRSYPEEASKGKRWC